MKFMHEATNSSSVGTWYEIHPVTTDGQTVVTNVCIPCGKSLQEAVNKLSELRESEADPMYVIVEVVITHHILTAHEVNKRLMK